MTTRFANTFYFIALTNTNDSAHTEALRLAAEAPSPIVTTIWVLTELAEAMASPANRPVFVRLFEGLRSRNSVVIIPPDLDLFNRGFDLYSRRPDKGWSLTDCISFIVMTDRGIVDALTGDRHFEHAGFHALFLSQE